MTATADSLRYTRWSKEELNERIIALYEQIERITMDNLSVAKENSELEIQISTID